MKPNGAHLFSSGVYGDKNYYYWSCECGDHMEGTVTTKREALGRLRAHRNFIYDQSMGTFDRAMGNLETQGVLFDG